MSSFQPIVEPKDTSKWGKQFIIDMNERIAKINTYIDDGVLKMETSMTKNLASMQATIKESVQSTVTDAVAELVIRLDETEKTAKLNQAKIKSLENKITIMNSQFRFIESRKRRKNLVFHGVEEGEAESEQIRIRKIKTIINNMNIGENIEIKNCFRSNGPKTNERKPVCVTFVFADQRKSVWDARKRLRDTSYYVTEDFAPDVLRERRKLYQILNVANTLAGYRENTFVKFDKLVCYGRSYTCDTLHLLPAQLQPRRASERVTADMVLFGGPNSGEHPLCNWKKLDTPIVYEGVSFPTSEHAYLYQKAKLAGAQEVCQNILSSDDPADAKRYSHDIRRPHKEWNNNKRGVMKRILVKKFQDPDLAKELRSTGNRKLHEAGRSKYWATGLSMNHKKASDANSWTGSSVLGKVLEEIRANI